MKEPNEEYPHINNNTTSKMVTKQKTTSIEDENGKSLFHINRKTLPLKITLFLYYGAMSAVLPYLTIHMKDIGISLSQIAIIYAVLPFTAFLGPPIMGFMADKFGQYKAVLVVAVVINAVAHTLLLTVPKYSESLVYAPTVIEFSGGGGGNPTSAVLRPLNASHCVQFITSLRRRQSDKPGHSTNSIINVHSCSSDDEGSSENSPLTRGLAPPLPWNIPNLCRPEEEASSNENMEDDSIPEFICGGDGDNDSHMVELTNKNRTRRSVAANPSNSDCSVRLRLNGVVTGEGIQQPQQVICQTNFTYPTGDVIKNGNGPLTFWLYFLYRIVGNIFMSACYSLLDATTLAVVELNKGAEYGKERILCVVGSSIFSPLTGLLVDFFSASKGYTDYSSAFYVADAMLVLNVIGFFFMKLDVEKPENDMWKNASALLNYPEVIVFLTMIFIMGNMWGFVESYLFIFLDELHAPKYLLGLTLTVGSLTSVPFLYVAEDMVAKVGRVNIIVLAFLFYFVRCFGYSYIPNPFWCFPFEAMEAFTYHLMWVAAATYCAVLSPKGLLGTLTGVMGSLHYGLGKGSGAFIGGYVISMSSSRLAFRYFGIIAGAMGLIYFLINSLWLEKTIRKRNERENEENSNVRKNNKAEKQGMLKNNQSA